MSQTPRALFNRFSTQIFMVLLGIIWIISVSLRANGNLSEANSDSSIVTTVKLVESKNQTPIKQDNNFVEKETCITCHKDKDKSLEKTLHGKSVDMRTPAARGDQTCETCHGPGKAHAESGDKKDIKSFKVLTARAANATCMSCHENRKTHINWSGSKHDVRNVSCVSCHSVHNPKSESAQLKTVRATETCVSCHKEQAIKFKKSSHMPLTEGKMECISCHTPHGSTNVKMLKVGNTVNESCVSCHTEKRGPFLWEHAPVSKSCVTCHSPHGSNNDRMLIAKVPMLCQRCHVPSRHPATIYDGTQLANASNRLLGRGCVTCHQQIHGSNSPAGHFWHR